MLTIFPEDIHRIVCSPFVVAVERMGAERELFLLLQFQYVLALLASVHIEQGV